MVAFMIIEYRNFLKGLTTLLVEAFVLVSEDLVLHHAALLKHSCDALLILQRCLLVKATYDTRSMLHNFLDVLLQIFYSGLVVE